MTKKEILIMQTEEVLTKIEELLREYELNICPYGHRINFCPQCGEKLISEINKQSYERIVGLIAEFKEQMRIKFNQSDKWQIRKEICELAGLDFDVIFPEVEIGNMRQRRGYSAERLFNKLLCDNKGDIIKVAEILKNTEPERFVGMFVGGGFTRLSSKIVEILNSARLSNKK